MAGCVAAFVVPRRFFDAGGVCVCGALITAVAGLCCSGIFHVALPAMIGTCDGMSVAAAVFTGGGAVVFTTGVAGGVAATSGSSFFGEGVGAAMLAGAAPKVMFRASPDFVT